MYKRLSQVSSDLQNLRSKGVEKGKSIGWAWHLLPITIKRSCTTYIAAAPGSGKTEWWLEVLINLSITHGWRHAIFTPETGEYHEVYAELCHKYIGKPFIEGEGSMTESERAMSEQFIDEHFVVIDPVDEELTIFQFYELIDRIETDTGKPIHTTTIDPWNELTEEFIKEDLGREDKYLSRILGHVRKNARKTKRHNCVINHVRDQTPIKRAGLTFYPPPTARDFAGGQVWFRKGLMMLTLWRPPIGLNDKDGIPYPANTLEIKVVKSKPKGVSLNGTYRLYLDTKRYQYFIQKGQKKFYADRGTELSFEWEEDQDIISKGSITQEDEIEFSTEKQDDLPF